MTVIKLKSGGLWVHAPIAPTRYELKLPPTLAKPLDMPFHPLRAPAWVCRECVALVKELGYPVEHIILPTFAYEHKIFVGPFSRAFPAAKVHIAPRSVGIDGACVCLAKQLTGDSQNSLYLGVAFSITERICMCRQWSWPIKLPPQFFGIFPTSVLQHCDVSAPWSSEIEQKVLFSSVGTPLCLSEAGSGYL